VIKPQFDWAWDFSEGLAAIKMKDQFGFINEKGEIILKPIYEEVRFIFSNDLACVKKEGKWGFIDPEGTFKIPNVYQDCWPFTEGLAAVQEKDNYGYLNPQGKFKIPLKLARDTVDYPGNFYHGLAPLWGKHKMLPVGYINKKGQAIIPHP
jgi:hypothetical protein